MWEKYAVNLADSFNLPNPGLRAYLTHVVEGNQEVYRPPFWKGVKPASVLKTWESVLAQTDIKTKWPQLHSYEMEMKSKVGPMSFQLPLKERLHDVESYYTLVQLQSEPIRTSAVQAAKEYYGRIHDVHLASVQDVVSNMRLDTNSGSPDFIKRRRALDETVKMLPPTSMDIDTQYELVAVLGWRGQEGGPSIKDVKQRVVWMMPMALNIREAQVYQPLIQAIQKENLIPAYVSNDAVDKAITETFKVKAPDSDVICTDFSKFDQHFNSHMSEGALQLISSMVAPTRGFKEWQKSIFPQKYHIPLVCSEKIGFKGDHGMGSGSNGTNFDESMTHTELQYEAAEDCNDQLVPTSGRLGDDGYLGSFDGRLTVDSIMHTYQRHGQEMNAEKQYVSSHDCIYLRRYHHEDYRVGGIMVGIYPTFRALGRLLYQERYYDPDVWGPKMVILRAWSILENCNQHPCFEEFVDFVMKGDKFRLGLDIPGFLEDIGHLSKEATELMPDFLGYNQTNMSSTPGIQQWRIYRYLKSKA